MGKGRILIVEDTDDFRKIYGDRFRFGGYEVLDAVDGDDALRVLRSEHVDAVMTDINMPNKDGYALIADMKKDDKLKNIPILVMSVFDQTEALKKALELGASDYLVKGFHTPNAVMEKIEGFLKK